MQSVQPISGEFLDINVGHLLNSDTLDVLTVQKQSQLLQWNRIENDGQIKAHLPLANNMAPESNKIVAGNLSGSEVPQILVVSNGFVTAGSRYIRLKGWSQVNGQWMSLPNYLINIEVNSQDKIEVIDYDGDGDIDIVFIDYTKIDDFSYSPTFSVYENNGQGFNSKPQLLFEILKPLSHFEFVDLDNDADMDFVAKLADDSLFVNFNQFQGWSEYPPIATPASNFILEDLNNDNLLDIIVYLIFKPLCVLVFFYYLHLVLMHDCIYLLHWSFFLSRI